MNFDYSFYTWELLSNYVLSGFYFSLWLTLVATLGGVFFGTLLALMRLSGRNWLVLPATIYVNGMRSIPLVMVILWFFLLMPMILGVSVGAETSAIILPQAFRNMLPILLTQTIILFQDTSLVYAIGAYDLLKGFETAGKNFGRPIEAYIGAAVPLLSKTK